MKKILLAIALLAAATTASAHPYPTSHYHDVNGRFVIGNQIAPRTSTNYIVDNYGNQVRVVTTTRCTNMYLNSQSNEMGCTEEETTEHRYVETYNNYRPGYGVVSPVYVEPFVPYIYYGGRAYNHGPRHDFHNGGHHNHHR